MCAISSTLRSRPATRLALSAMHHRVAISKNPCWAKCVASSSLDWNASPCSGRSVPAMRWRRSAPTRSSRNCGRTFSTGMAPKVAPTRVCSAHCCGHPVLALPVFIRRMAVAFTSIRQRCRGGSICNGRARVINAAGATGMPKGRNSHSEQAGSVRGACAPPSPVSGDEAPAHQIRSSAIRLTSRQHR